MPQICRSSILGCVRDASGCNRSCLLSALAKHVVDCLSGRRQSWRNFVPQKDRSPVVENGRTHTPLSAISVWSSCDDLRLLRQSFENRHTSLPPAIAL